MRKTGPEGEKEGTCREKRTCMIKTERVREKKDLMEKDRICRKQKGL